MNNKFKFVWSQSAYRDLANIIQYISLDTPTNANKIYLKSKTPFPTFTTLHIVWRIVSELQDQGVLLYRELVIPLG